MRKIILSTSFNTSLDSLWEKFEKVDDYPRYIKFCHKAALVGPFAAGSKWYDWSRVAFIPLKITHSIEKIEPKKEIVYKIDLPSGGEIWQKFKFGEEAGKAKIDIEITIEFNHKIVDQVIGPIIYSRNKNMILGTMANFKKENQ